MTGENESKDKTKDESREVGKKDDDWLGKKITCSVCWNERNVEHVFGVPLQPKTATHMCFGCFSYYIYDVRRREEEERAASADVTDVERGRVFFTYAGRRVRVTQCPACGHGVEKSGGCDIVRCHCGSVFRYSTGLRLDEAEYGECADTYMDEEYIAMLAMTEEEMRKLLQEPFLTMLFITLMVAVGVACYNGNNVLTVVGMAAIGLSVAVGAAALTSELHVAWTLLAFLLMYIISCEFISFLSPLVFSTLGEHST